MVKKIAEMTSPVPPPLLEQAQKINPPKDYFRGWDLADLVLPANVLLFTRKAGYDINKDKPNVFHSRNLLLVPLSGRGRVVVNGRVSQLEPGHCMFIEPYQFHHYSDVQTDNLCWLFITFDGSGGLKSGIVRIKRPASFWSDLQELVDTYLDEERNAQRLLLRLALILDGLRESSGGRELLKSSRDEELLVRVHQLTRAHLSQPLSIGQMSQQLGMSESSLRSRFRKITGYSVGNFQQRIRLLEASKMLREKDVSVSEAATACGWDSPYSFSRAFSAYWGVPPKRFSMGVGSPERQSG